MSQAVAATSLDFTVLDVVAEPYAAAPQLTARLRITESTGAVVHALTLRCQVRIEAQRRHYSDQDAEALRSVFDDRSRWSDTLRPFLWMQCHTTVPGFTGVTDVDLAMPCTYDFDVTASRYLHALTDGPDGTVPLAFLFSGTVFVRGDSGFAVEQVPWDRDARFALPVNTWHQMMRLYYPGTGWVRLDQDLLRELADYRSRHGLTGWDETVQRLLARSTAEGEVRP